MAFVSPPSYAKDEYRQPAWTWRLYSGNSGDYDVPQGPIDAFNQYQETRYNSCMATNCGSGSTSNPGGCNKSIYSGLTPWPGTDVVNGVPSRQMTVSQAFTDAAPACTSNGVVVYAGRSPTTTSQGATIAVTALLHCTDQYLPSNSNRHTVVIGGQTHNAYDATCVRPTPDPPCCKDKASLNTDTQFGDPVDALSAAQVESETDYASADGLLNVSRSYSSQLGRWNWDNLSSVVDFTGRASSHPPQTFLIANVKQIPPGYYPNLQLIPSPINTPRLFALAAMPGTANQVWVVSADGQRSVFSEIAPGQFSTSALRKPQLSLITDGSGAQQWLFREGNHLDVFGINGQLLQRRFADGKALAYQQQGTTLSVTANTSGSTLTYSRSSETLPAGVYDTIALPDNSQLHYSIDGHALVTAVAFGDGTSKSYLYDEVAYAGFDSSGSIATPNRLTGATDENNIRVATFTYDYYGPIATQQAGGVNNYSFVFSLPGSTGTTKITMPPQGGLTTFGWGTGPDGERRLASKSQLAASGSGNVTANFTYDTNGNLASKADFNGNRTCYAYDLVSNLETTRLEGLNSGASCPTNLVSYSVPTNTVQRKISTRWHPDWSFEIQRAEPKKLTTYVYNGQPDPTLGNTMAFCAPAGAVLPDGKPIAVICKKVIQETTDSTGSLGFSAISSSQPPRTWTYTYNGYGQVLTVDGPRTDISDVTTYSYYNCSTGYQCGQLQTVTDALGHVTTYNTYNAHGQPLTITDPNGVVTTLTYDMRQRLISRSVGSEATAFTHWPTGLLKQVTLSDGSYLQYSYDSAHRLTMISDALGNKVTYMLDAMGNHTAENLYDPSNALARTHSKVFNSLNQLYKDVPASGTTSQTTVFGYDNNGNSTTISAPLTRNTSNQYDALNRLTQVTDAAGGIAKYQYNANDNLVSVIDPRNLTTSYTFNGLGDQTVLVSPDTGTTTNTFDSAGNLKTRTDANSQAATLSYDALNRLTQTAYSDQTIAYQYDQGTNGIGHLTSFSDASGSTSLTYTSQGRLASKTQITSGISRTVSYGYNSAGQLTSMNTPSGQVISYGYTNNQITSIALNGSNIISNVVYDPFGPARQWQWGNGTYTNRTYDQDGKLTQVDSAGLNTYSFDDAFRITANTDTVNSANSWSYGYNSLDRLTSAAKSSLSQTWSYDANGNRLTQGGTTSSTYTVASTSNRLNSVSGALTRSYSYDNAGNTLSDGTRSFTYNAASRMVTATNTGLTTTYAYNALGQRVKKSNANGTTYFIYDQAGHVLGSYNNSGNLIEELLYLGDIPIATIRISTDGVTAGVFYIHTDNLNTPRKITNPTDNTIIWRWDSDGFENGAPNQDPDANSSIVQFDGRGAGQIANSETSILTNGLRDLDTPTFRFWEADPVGLNGGSYSLYAALNNNPISNVDPYGLWVPPSIPEPIYNFTVGLADDLSWGIGPLARRAFDIDGSVNRCSSAYKAGEYASLAVGLGRVAYAGAAKAIAMTATSGIEAAAGRNLMKQVFRGPLGGSSYKMYSYEQLLSKYGSDAAVKEAAGRTSPLWNAMGADAGLGGAANAASCGCQ